MSEQLNALMSKYGSEYNYSIDFRNYLEDNMGLLRTLGATSIPVPIEKAHAYKNNLYGLLSELKFSVADFWIIMRVNHWRAPTDFNEEVSELTVPSEALLGQLRSDYNTVVKRV
jgi:hypothetical protein